MERNIKFSSTQYAIILLILSLATAFLPDTVSLVVFFIGFLLLILSGHASAIRKLGAKDYFLSIDPFRVLGIDLKPREEIFVKFGLALVVGAFGSLGLRIILKI